MYNGNCVHLSKGQVHFYIPYPTNKGAFKPGIIDGHTRTMIHREAQLRDGFKKEENEDVETVDEIS